MQAKDITDIVKKAKNKDADVEEVYFTFERMK